MSTNRPTAAEIASNPGFMALWAIALGHLTGRYMVCICCGATGCQDEEKITKPVLELLRAMGFGETIARADRDFVTMMDKARQEGRWYGPPYTLPVITGDGFLLKYLLEDAEQVFERQDPKFNQPKSE